MLKAKMMYATVVVSLLAFQSAARGQAVQTANVSPDTALITSINLEGIQKILQGMGFDVTRDKEADGKPSEYLFFQTEGYRSVVVINEGDVTLLNVTTGKFVPSAFNEWNKKNASCCFAFLSDDNLAYLATQFGLEGGVTRGAIESRIKKFRDNVAYWKRFLSDRQVKEPAPTGK
jgi:hypothetical protein